jgi:hypothetical protein
VENIHEIFERMDLAKIRSFILTGVDSQNDNEKIIDYERRIQDANEPLLKRFEAMDEKERNGFYDSVLKALVVREEIFLEIGMIAGARIISQLLSDAADNPLDNLRKNNH